MSVSAKALTYSSRVKPGEELIMNVDESTLSKPSGSQSLVKFLVSSISPTDYAIMHAAEQSDAPSPPTMTKKRFAQAHEVKPIRAIHHVFDKLPSLPAVGGLEGVAVVEEPGPNSKLKAGDWVIPLPGVGTWRTHALVDESQVIPVRNDIQPEYAAVLGLGPATGYRLFHDFVNLKEGDWIALNYSDSMVGQTVVQLAVNKGVKVIALLTPYQHIQMFSAHLKALGVDIVVNENVINSWNMREMLSNLPPVKLGLDCIGGDSGRKVARVVGKGGTFVSYGNVDASGFYASYKPFMIPTEKDLKIKQFLLSDWLAKSSQDEKKKMIDELAAMVKDSNLHLLIERKPFESHRLALRLGWEMMRDRRLVMNHGPVVSTGEYFPPKKFLFIVIHSYALGTVANSKPAIVARSHVETLVISSVPLSNLCREPVEMLFERGIQTPPYSVGGETSKCQYKGERRRSPWAVSRGQSQQSACVIFNNIIPKPAVWVLRLRSDRLSRVSAHGAAAESWPGTVSGWAACPAASLAGGRFPTESRRRRSLALRTAAGPPGGTPPGSLCRHVRYGTVVPGYPAGTVPSPSDRPARRPGRPAPGAVSPSLQVAQRAGGHARRPESPCRPGVTASQPGTVTATAAAPAAAGRPPPHGTVSPTLAVIGSRVRLTVRYGTR
eukprot:748218-Hanusia_phi.AAC.1